MPRLPMPKTDEESYQKNTREQYECLGRFVEAFEAMVEEVRFSAIDILSNDEEHRKLVDVAFHHQSLTAKPLFEIMRAIIADLLKRPDLKVPIKECEIFSGVLANIDKEYSELSNIRNNLLHGTWYVGYVDFNDPNSETFIVNKYKVTKKGLSKEDSPKSAKELMNLKDRCEKTSNWISFLVSCLPIDPQTETNIAQLFQFKDGKWWLCYRDTPSETLP